MSNLSVYGDFHSTCTQAVLTALAEKQAKFDFSLVSLAKGEHKSAEHLKRQPFGKVPAITDGQLTLFESRAIARYINDKFTSGNSLLPTCPCERAIEDQWLSLEQGTINPQLSTILFNRVWGPVFYGLKTDEAAVAKAVETLNPVFDYLDKHLASHGKKYLLGDQYTLVDIFLTPYLNLIEQTPEKSILHSRPNVAKYWKNLQERPSWKEVSAKVAAAH